MGAMPGRSTHPRQAHGFRASTRSRTRRRSPSPGKGTPRHRSSCSRRGRRRADPGGWSWGNSSHCWVHSQTALSASLLLTQTQPDYYTPPVTCCRGLLKGAGSAPARSSPEFPYLGRQHVLDVLDLALRNPMLEHRKDTPSHLFRVDIVVIPEILLDPGEELVLVAFL
jgi:hypothetical protein